MKSMVRLGPWPEPAEGLSGFPFRVWLRFARAHVVVAATSPDVPDYLRQVFRYFLVAEPGSEARASSLRMLVIDPGARVGTSMGKLLPRLPREEGTLVLPSWWEWGFVIGSPTLTNYYASKLIRLGIVAATWNEFVTLHAATVEIDGIGVVLVGEAAAGKTSLTLSLVDDGHRYAADDTTPVRRSDLSVQPFPTPFLMRDEPGDKLVSLPRRPPDLVLVEEPRWFVERADAVAPQITPRLLVFLDREASGIIRIPPGLAALRMLGNTVFPLGLDLTGGSAAQQDLVDFHARLAATAPAFPARHRRPE